MYDGRFTNAKNRKGKLYRDKVTGNLIEYCPHRFAIYPRFENITTYHAGFVPEQGEKFLQFTGICQLCGQVIIIYAEDVFENTEKFEKHIKKVIKEREISQED